MNLNDKIVKIIDSLQLSNTKFADNIDVSRPTISHIISGRNKPSIDVIQKIMVRYPQLGYNWFLDDEFLDEEKLTQLAASEQDDHTNDDKVSPLESRRTSPLKESAEQRIAPAASKTENKGGTGVTQRRVEKVIVFYSDGTMEVLSGAVAV